MTVPYKDKVEKAAYDNGKEAFFNNVPNDIDHNPYYPGEGTWVLWFQGWEDAEREYGNENNNNIQKL